MRRIVLNISLIATLALFAALSVLPASAASLSVHHVVRVNTPAYGSCYYSPNETTCDGQDPYSQGCDKISSKLGGDPWYLQVYWAYDGSHCYSNWGIAWANPSNQYVQMVWIERQNSKTLYYCTAAAVPGPCHHLNIQASIPNGYHSWHTDLLYAPSTSVQVCEIWSPYIGSLSGSNSGCSIWH